MGAGRGTGQATVEFGIVSGLVLLLLLGSTQIGLYALTRGTAVTAAERGIYVAVGAAGTPSGRPATAAVYLAIRAQLASGLVGATTSEMQPAHGSCPALGASWPIGTVYVCSVANPAANTVEVAIRGWVRAAVPPSFGLGGSGWRAGALPIDVDDIVHTAVFAP
jgi:TadE-like protein